MTRGGKRPRAGRPRENGTGSTLSVYLSTSDRAELEAEAGDRTVASHLRDTWTRTRAAISEIESMIRGCKLTESTARGKQLETVETQRRTLEFVLGLLTGRDAALKEARRRT
jgi:hypothetical protein